MDLRVVVYYGRDVMRCNLCCGQAIEGNRVKRYTATRCEIYFQVI